MNTLNLSLVYLFLQAFKRFTLAICDVTIHSDLTLVLTLLSGVEFGSSCVSHV